LVPIAVGLCGNCFAASGSAANHATNNQYALPVCVLASAPLGLTEMTLMADDINRELRHTRCHHADPAHGNGCCDGTVFCIAGRKIADALG
jgi:hypothetical protein